MASIFNKTNNLYENPKRNTFDHSFQNNLTFNFGELVPCFCKECIPGDSFKIDPTLAIKMIPMLFPVQTRIRAHVHFFYVSNRSLWRDWMDFIGNTKQNLEIPYISYNKEKVYTGSLYDYMGLPTTSFGQSIINATLSPTYSNVTSYSYAGANMGVVSIRKRYNPFLQILCPNDSRLVTPVVSERNNFYKSYNMQMKELGEDVFNMQIHAGVTSGQLQVGMCYFGNLNYNPLGFVNSNGDIIDEDGFFPLFLASNTLLNGTATQQEQARNFVILAHNENTGDEYVFRAPIANQYDYNTSRCYYGFEYVDALTIDEVPLENVRNDEGFKYDCAFLEVMVENGDLSTYFSGVNYFSGSATSNTTIDSTFAYRIVNDAGVKDISSDDISNNVYNQLKISALPFRAYEAIYNSFYRDDRNNPLIENGEPVYNKYILNNNGGEDSFNYEIRKRNWEADFLTTAVQSPQQGVAPLVGITANGEISFKDTETGDVYTAQLNTNDGDTISSFTVTSSDMPSANLRQLVDFASAGISISDLRGVNALQRWLEINMRRGLRYKDQIMSHFGVDVRYDELMMPEFIGGFSQDVYVNQINQTMADSKDPLGSYAGQGGAFGSSKHSINHYCQEHGYIIGIMSVVPVANYSQLLPKHFLKRDLLDYFFPEFGHLGMQPITYQEVCPIEAVNNSVPLTDVFGYNRAWYDYLASTDEVHGLFRTTLRNFCINRKFDGVPELGSQFLTIDHNDLDDVFAETSSDHSHKFLGQIYYDCKIKRPIPEYGIPKLEV